MLICKVINEIHIILIFFEMWISAIKLLLNITSSHFISKKYLGQQKMMYLDKNLDQIH